MKKILNVFVVLFLLTTTVASARNTDEVKHSKEKQKNIFVMKTQKKFLGARVEILSADGDVITAQNLERRKVVIDFAAVKFGTYTIRVSKGEETKEFLYVKK